MLFSGFRMTTMNFKIIILFVWCFSWTLGYKNNEQFSELSKGLVEHVEQQQQPEKYIFKRLAEVIMKGKRREWSHSNHPPDADDAVEEIPVRVVYEGEDSASERSINNVKSVRSRGNKRYRNNVSTTESTIVSTKTTNLEPNNEKLTISSTEVPKISTTTLKVILQSTSVTHDVSTEKNIPRRTKNKELSKNKTEVPVSIVYDAINKVKGLRNHNNTATTDTKTETTQKAEKINDSISSDTTTEKQIEPFDKINKVIKTEISKVIDDNKTLIFTAEKDIKALTKTGKTIPQHEIDGSKIIVPRDTTINTSTTETTMTPLKDTTTEKEIKVIKSTHKTTPEITTTRPNLSITISTTETIKHLEIESKTATEKEATKDESKKNKQPDVVLTQETKQNSTLLDANNESEQITRKSKYIRQRDPIVPIIENTNNIYAHIGKFDYSYEGGDGTKSFQSGVLKENTEKHAGEAVVGGFSYKDKDGQDFEISYTADENGYRPVGAHLPTPPPVPAAIARALLYLATKTTPEPVTKSIQDIE